MVIDTNPIWWGKKALGEAEVHLWGLLLLLVISEGNNFFNKNLSE